MAIDRVTGRFLDDARLAILFELVQDLLADERAELGGEAQDVRAGVVDSGEAERGGVDRGDGVGE